MEATITRKGMRVVPRHGNSLSHFTPYKIYEVIAGSGEINQAPNAARFCKPVHSERTMNVIDDAGNIRFVTLDFFREFRLESGVLYHE